MARSDPSVYRPAGTAGVHLIQARRDLSPRPSPNLFAAPGIAV
ncbi:hypothetical protein OIE52_05395 [Streptomyces canus]|nr:hypothetical protein [Streptomyces canus]